MDSLKERLYNLQNNYEFIKGFQELQEIMHEIALSKGWHNPSKTFGEQIVMMHSELSEVIEAYRTENGGTTGIYTDNDTGKPEGVPIEFADLQIRMLDTVEFYGISLLDATFMKAQFNLSRPHRHGNKKL